MLFWRSAKRGVIVNVARPENNTMHSLFTLADTLDAATYLHSVVQPNNSFALQWLMPVTGLTENGQAAEPVGFSKSYGLYLAIDASGFLNTGGPPTYTSINVEFLADPKNDAGTPSSTVQSGVALSGTTANDIVLATGKLVSGRMSMDPNTMIRMATYVEQLNPTLDGTVLLHGSIHQGDLLTENFVTQPNEFQAVPQPDGTTVQPVLNFLHHPGRSDRGV